MITIMTPTYNRAYILKEAYDSLRKQSSFDFEWIIVDDGSTDETEEIVRVWVEEEKNFSIVYEKQKNVAIYNRCSNSSYNSNSNYYKKQCFTLQHTECRSVIQNVCNVKYILNKGYAFTNKHIG